MYNVLCTLRVTRSASCLTKRSISVNRSRTGAERLDVCEWRLLVLRCESFTFTRMFYEFNEIEPLRRSPNVPSCARAGHVAIVPAIRSSRELEVVRFRRHGETIVTVQVRLTVLGRDLHVKIMYDVGEEEEQRGARYLLAQTASLA